MISDFFLLLLFDDLLTPFKMVTKNLQHFEFPLVKSYQAMVNLKYWLFQTYIW